MKQKWKATYWCDELDREVVKYFDSYEKAMEFKHKREPRLARTVHVTLR